MTESTLASLARLKKAREQSHTSTPVHTSDVHAETSFLADTSASIFGDDDELDSPLLAFDANTVGGDDLGVFAIEEDEPAAAPKANVAKADLNDVADLYDWDFTKNDKLMLNAIDRCGPLTGAHLALACGKKYETKKGRIAFLESKGYLVSERRMGIKMYNLGQNGRIRIGKGKEKPDSIPEMVKWRHHFMVATQVLTLQNEFKDREPTEKEAALPQTPFWGTGKRILKTPFANNALPVLTEKTLHEQVAVAEQILSSSKNYGTDYKYRADLYRQVWRKKCQEILDDPNYPAVTLNPKAVGKITPAMREKLLNYWKDEQGGYAAAAFIHWDDKMKFGGKGASKVGKESHKRRADAIIPLPHILTPDGKTLGGSIAVEVELTRKSIDEYCEIIPQWFDHPLIGVLVYIVDDSTIASTLRAAREKLIASGRITEEQFAQFLFVMRRPVYINGHLDDEGYFG